MSWLTRRNLFLGFKIEGINLLSDLAICIRSNAAAIWFSECMRAPIDHLHLSILHSSSLILSSCVFVGYLGHHTMSFYYPSSDYEYYISCYNTQWSGCGLAIVNYKKSLSSYIFYSTFTADFIFPSTYYYFLLLFISNSFSVFFLFISVSKFRSTAPEFFSLCLSVALSLSLFTSILSLSIYLFLAPLLPFFRASFHQISQSPLFKY